MLGYVRPPLPDLVFHDEAGDVIPYGRRWEHLDWDGPEETYSVTQHPQRFAPVVDAARAMIDHLLAAYDVTADEDGAIVTVRPNGADTAPIAFTFGPFPSVSVVAGKLTALDQMCGCDHCDEDVASVIEELEENVFAVVEGRLREWLNDRERVDEDDDLFLAHAIDSPDGLAGSSGSSSVDDTAERDRLRRLFADVPARWAPWTPRPL